MSWWDRPDEVEGEGYRYDDPLSWAITLAIAGVVGGLLLMLAG
ncbi:MAG: hypothetical protein U1E59_13780 [Amaricoccus sp.]